MFPPVPAEADFTGLEAEELARWGEHRVFERSVELRDGAEPWVFYEGPPTANGRPGLHHVWARVYKDLFCRYRTMRGYAVPRKAGWDTHGLPVEVEVEKQLGITAKRQIEEEVGIAEFTRLCRESVRNYVDEWKTLTERIGYWIDIDDAYWTFSPEYIESVWWNLKSLWDQGLLYEDIKVVPYCPRCGTALSSHELGQPDVYRDVVDESAYVLLPLTDEGAPPTGSGRPGRPPSPACPWWSGRPRRGRCCPTPVPRSGPTSSTPWSATPSWPPTWSSRCSARASASTSGCPGATWSDCATSGRSTTWTPAPATAATAGGWWPATSSRPTRGPASSTWPRPSARSTGRSGRRTSSPPSTRSGPTDASPAEVGWLAGQAVRDTNGTVNDRLEAAGLLFRRQPYRHSYPHCWRCGTAAHLLGQAELVHPDVGAEGRPGGPEPDHRLAPRAHPGRADGGVAGQQRRLGPVPRPVLGHAAARLAVRPGHSAVSARWPSCRSWPARDVAAVDPHRPAIDDVDVPLPRLRRPTLRRR